MMSIDSKTLMMSLLVGCLLGCAAVSPKASSGRAPALRAQVVQVVQATEVMNSPPPTLEAPPAADEEGCVGANEAHTFRQSLVRYYAQMREHTLRQNGWNEPDSARVKVTAISELRWASPTAATMKPNAEFDIVEGETYWTFLGDTSSSCGSPSTGWLHVDSKGTYFSMIPNRVCGRTEIVKVCGSMAGGGCGRESRTRGHGWHVHLAEGEGIYTGERIVMDVNIPVCYSIQPTGGFNRPP